MKNLTSCIIGTLFASVAYSAYASDFETPDSYGPKGKSTYTSGYAVSGWTEKQAEEAHREALCRQDIRPVYCVLGANGGGSTGGSDSPSGASDSK